MDDRQSALSSASIAAATTAEPTLRTIAFTIAGYRFALPIAAVLQVGACPSQLGIADRTLGLVIYEDRTILLLNLRAKLAQLELPGVVGSAAAALDNRAALAATPQPYLILTRTQRGELCGVLVDELPAMLELPRRDIQPIPKSYRQSHLAGLARFVALWQPQSQAEKTAIYLLDVDQAIERLS